MRAEQKRHTMKEIEMWFSYGRRVFVVQDPGVCEYVHAMQDPGWENYCTLCYFVRLWSETRQQPTRTCLRSAFVDPVFRYVFDFEE